MYLYVYIAMYLCTYACIDTCVYVYVCMQLVSAALHPKTYTDICIYIYIYRSYRTGGCRACVFAYHSFEWF